MANKMVNYLVLGLDWMLDYSTEAGLDVWRDARIIGVMYRRSF
jgi:hypothetical protein